MDTGVTTPKKFMKMAKAEIKSKKIEFVKPAFNIAAFKTRRLMFQKYGKLNFDAELAESGVSNFLSFYMEVLDSTKKTP